MIGRYGKNIYFVDIWFDCSYDEVWNLPYIPVHGDDKIIFGSMTTYNPFLLVSKKSCDS